VIFVHCTTLSSKKKRLKRKLFIFPIFLFRVTVVNLIFLTGIGLEKFTFSVLINNIPQVHILILKMILNNNFQYRFVTDVADHCY